MEELNLTEDEQKALVQQREFVKKLEEFKEKYRELVKSTGFTWVVNYRSPIGSPDLMITPVK